MSSQANQLVAFDAHNVLLALIGLRIINALTIRTFFQPDEYFQALEPAWEIAFGDSSGAWITWEWNYQLRSSIYPWLFAAVYRTAALFCDSFKISLPDRSQVLIAAPKLLQAVFAASIDYFTWQLGGCVFGRHSQAAWACLVLTVFSPWQWFCSTRTLSNCIETSLTIIALYLWPWEWFEDKNSVASGDRSETHLWNAEIRARRNNNVSPDVRQTSTPRYLYLSMSFLLAAFACILRPTNLLIWMCISIPTLYYSNRIQRLALVKSSITSGVAILVLSVISDRLYYQEWTFTPLCFVYFNLAQSLAVFYGVNRPDYYFTEGIPLLLTTALPFAAVGLWWSINGSLEIRSRNTKPPSKTSKSSSSIQSRHGDSSSLITASGSRQLSVLGCTCILVPIALSFISHKEVRFIYPILPLLHIQAAGPLAAFLGPIFRLANSGTSSSVSMKRNRLTFVTTVTLVAINVIIASYTTQVHQRGVIDVLAFLRSEYETMQESNSLPGQDSIMTVGFLMPCHSTPWRSHLVYPEIHAWALTCEPPVHLPVGPERDGYMDEADVFYQDPAKWLHDHMVTDLNRREKGEKRLKHTEQIRSTEQTELESRKWPDYVVFFAQLEQTMGRALNRSGYRECWRGFNSHWHDDWRRTGDVVVWCLKDAKRRPDSA